MMMKIVAAGLVVAGLSAAAPAMAQGIMIGPDGVRVVQPEQQMENRRDMRDGDRRQSSEISEREAVSIARGEGVREVADVRRTRSSYRVEGFDRRGDDIRVDIDRRDGAVIAVR